MTLWRDYLSCCMCEKHQRWSQVCRYSCGLCVTVHDTVSHTQCHHGACVCAGKPLGCGGLCPTQCKRPQTLWGRAGRAVRCAGETERQGEAACTLLRVRGAGLPRDRLCGWSLSGMVRGYRTRGRHPSGLRRAWCGRPCDKPEAGEAHACGVCVQGHQTDSC